MYSKNINYPLPIAFLWPAIFDFEWKEKQLIHKKNNWFENISHLNFWQETAKSDYIEIIQKYINHGIECILVKKEEDGGLCFRFKT